MKIAVIGASGLIGTKLVELLTADGHDVVAASRNTGVDVLTGEGLADALDGAQTCLSTSSTRPSFEDEPVMDFFTTSTTNLTRRREERGRRPLRRAVDRRRSTGCPTAGTCGPRSPRRR